MRVLKLYELSNHLGNVLSMATDQKLPVDDNGSISYFLAEVISYSDYYPFGSPMSERSWSGDFRYGFNGKEKDNEGMGGGSQTYDYGFRIYNPALARFLSVDPLRETFSFYSPYQFASNMPINSIDLDGLEAKLAIACIGYVPDDDNSFKARALKLETKYDYIYDKSTNGADFLSDLTKHTSDQGSIIRLVTFHHSGNGIYMENNNGFNHEYTSNNTENERHVSDLKNAMSTGAIKFEDKALWVLGGCFTYAGRSPGSLAGDITLQTGISTVGADGSVVPEIIEGRETGRLKVKGGYSGKVDHLIPAQIDHLKLTLRFEHLSGAILMWLVSVVFVNFLRFYFVFFSSILHSFRFDVRYVLFCQEWHQRWFVRL